MVLVLLVAISGLHYITKCRVCAILKDGKKHIKVKYLRTIKYECPWKVAKDDTN